MFVINKTVGTVDYFGGRVVIPYGGYVELTVDELADQGVQATKNYGWVEFSETKPEVSSAPIKEAIVFQTPDDDGGSATYPGETVAEAPAPVETPVEVVAEAPAPVEAPVEVVEAPAKKSRKQA